MEQSIQAKNVDYSVGNIEFDGSVLVTGEITDGFTFRSIGDLHVRKTMGGAHLEAGRDLALNG